MNLLESKNRIVNELRRIAGMKLSEAEKHKRAQTALDAWRAEVAEARHKRRQKRAAMSPLSGFRPIGYQYHIEAQRHFRRKQRKHARMLRAAGGSALVEVLLVAMLLIEVVAACAWFALWKGGVL
jgi:hypothetical protein